MAEYERLGSRSGTPRCGTYTPRTRKAFAATWWLVGCALVLTSLTLLISLIEIASGIDQSDRQYAPEKKENGRLPLLLDPSRLFRRPKRPMLIAEEDLSPDEMIELEFSQYKTRESMLSKLDLGAARRAQQLGELLGSFLASQRKVDLSPGLRGKNSIFKGDAWKYSNGEEAHVESSLEMVMPKSLFLEKLETCESLACLREAHALRQKAEEGTTAFNFPHAILLGWQKSATTSLYQHLSDHPAVLASVEKEPEFFTLKCRGNPFFGCRSEDQKHYIREILQRDRYIGAGGRLMAFEASTHYAMNGDVLAAGMQKAMPWIKVVASLREPISRAASMLVHMYDKGAGCLAENRKRSLYYCLTTASQLTGHPGPYNMLDSPHGNYSTALEAWMKTFDSNNLHVIQYESLVDQESNSSSKSLHKLKTFLNLDPSLPDSHLRLHNSRKEQINPEGWPMKVKEYQDLIERVSPDVERVVNLLEKHGLADGDEWMNNWKDVWEHNLNKHCNLKTGKCMIQLS